LRTAPNKGKKRAFLDRLQTVAMNQTANQTVETTVSVRRIGRMGRIRLAIALAVAAAAALSAWFFLYGDEGGSSNNLAKPDAASVAELKALAGSVGHAVYWAGERPSATYELTRTNGGDIYIRYLPAGVSVGDRRPNFLTVGTYPKANAFRTVRKAATKKGEIVRTLADGGLAVASPRRPESVYFAYPGSNLLVEVYDPSSQRALRAVVSGQVKPLQ
jgi:hypothetical protein